MSTATSPHGAVMTTLETPARRRGRARWRSAAIFVATLVATAIVAVIANLLVVFARDVWFDNLRKPAWTPPDWVLAATGTTLLAAVGVAGWRIGVRAPGSTAITLWVVQLGLTLGWAVLFFGLWVPRWALLEAVVLALVTAATLLAAWPYTRLGATLLVPYLAWIGVVIALNASIVALN